MSDQQATNRTAQLPVAMGCGVTVRQPTWRLDKVAARYTPEQTFDTFTRPAQVTVDLGDADITLDPEQWRVVIGLVQELLPTEPVNRGIPDNLDALMAAIEDADVLDGAV